MTALVKLLVVGWQEMLAKLDLMRIDSRTRRKRVGRAQAAEIELLGEVRKALCRYVSPQLAERILADIGSSDGDAQRECVRKQVAVMFADMRGFTALSERVGPTEIVRVLNEYFSLLTAIAVRHEGTVFSMAGDSLMVGYGIPVARDDSTEQAMRCAEEMMEEFEALARKWQMRYQATVGLGIGINTGEVVAAIVGSEHYMGYTIVGDAVNIAARLSQRARAGEILFSDSVKRVLDEHGYAIEAMPLPLLTLRGRSSPMAIYCLPLPERLSVTSIAC